MKIVNLGVVDSTNLQAKRYVEKGGPVPVWICAEWQTNGRGRADRDWVSRDGNLFTSGVYPALAETEQNAQCSFVAALATHDTIAGFAPNHDIRIKWPNDVLVRDAKIAGILLERAHASSGDFLIVGIGINLVDSPTIEGRKTTSLSALGVEAMPQDVLARLIENFEHWLGVFTQDGFFPIKDAWSACAYKPGGRVVAKIGDNTISGTSQGLDETGALVVKTGAGTLVKIGAGDVFFL